MLTVLISGNLTLSHDFVKQYIRKPPNFLEKSMRLFVVHNSNNYIVIRKMKHITNDYQSLYFWNTWEFSFPVINTVIPRRICHFHGETEFI
jgi:hypothetical protein